MLILLNDVVKSGISPAFPFFVTSACPSSSKVAGPLRLRCSWSGCSSVCIPDPTCPWGKPPGGEMVTKPVNSRCDEQSCQPLSSSSPFESVALREVWEPMEYILLLTLMLERRSFLRTSLRMSLTATDSNCWYRWISWLMVPSLAPSFLRVQETRSVFRVMTSKL